VQEKALVKWVIEGESDPEEAFSSATYIWDGKKLFLDADVAEKYRMGLTKNDIGNCIAAAMQMNIQNIQSSVSLKIKRDSMRDI